MYHSKENLQRRKNKIPKNLQYAPLLLPVFNGVLQKSGNRRGGAYCRFYGIIDLHDTSVVATNGMIIVAASINCFASH